MLYVCTCPKFELAKTLACMTVYSNAHMTIHYPMGSDLAKLNQPVMLPNEEYFGNS